MATPDFFTLLGDSQEKTVAEWRKVQDRIAAACNKIWHEVKPMLCIDSPEGHTDEAMDGLMVGPKDVLSYSWRALRESRYIHCEPTHIPSLTGSTVFFSKQSLRTRHTAHRIARLAFKGKTMKQLQSSVSFNYQNCDIEGHLLPYLRHSQHVVCGAVRIVTLISRAYLRHGIK